MRAITFFQEENYLNYTRKVYSFACHNYIFSTRASKSSTGPRTGPFTLSLRKTKIGNVLWAISISALPTLIKKYRCIEANCLKILRCH